MTAALSPELAIAYVLELSADVRAVVVLDGRGRRLAGPEALAVPAGALWAAADAPDVAVRVRGGVVIGARTEVHSLVAACGPLSLIGPTAIDARSAVDAMGSAAPRSDRSPDFGAPSVHGPAAPEPVRRPPAATVTETLRAAAEAVVSASKQAI